ncbi:hypothetical protein IFM89_007112 [Coptis chinensis]|uniref:F-box domain-containing protein n=1 Tax=Coptis chinensis TaxID=261450 RepID=A0A835H4U4_9MAGN|nr:hypothetical protein IFM89_007112 [Coptis chinensis]
MKRIDPEEMCLDMVLQGFTENKSGDLFSKLPTNIIQNNIFPRIPLKSLSQCRWVCTTWYNLILHPRFAQIHYHFSIQNNSSPFLILTDTQASHMYVIDSQIFDNFEPAQVERVALKRLVNELMVIGYANGLICVAEDFKHCRYTRSYVIYNPITGDHVALPSDTCIFKDVGFIAFGYDIVNNEYKVIRVRHHNCGGEVCTLGTTRWRRLEGVVPPFFKQFGILVKGNLHWISDELDKIVVFNVALEKFHEIQSPFHMPEPNIQKISLHAIEERLCLIGEPTLDTFEIWVMIDYDGLQGYWVKEYSFFNRQVCNSLVSRHGPYNVVKLKNGEFLVPYGDSDLGYFDIKKQSCRPIFMRSSDYRSLVPEFLVGSLFSPNHASRLAMSAQTQGRDPEREEVEEESIKDEEREDEQEIDLQVLQELSGELFSKLPSDIILNILCRVPLKDLISQCSLVCKTWYNLARHPRFRRNSLQMDHQVFDNLDTSAPVHFLDFLDEPTFQPKLYIIGFANGLLCLSEDPLLCDYPVFYYICNPITGEHITLPRPHGLEIVQLSAFVFDSSTSEYKVIRFYHGRNGGEVFTLGSSRWRRIENGVPKTIIGYPYPCGRLVNNHLHWISSVDGSPLTIIAFNLAAEEVHEIELPPIVSSGEISLDPNISISLAVIEERLCFTCERKLDDKYFEVWVMKDYGVQGSWAKVYVFNPELTGALSDALTPCLTKLLNGEFLVQYGVNALVYYDPKKETCRPILVEVKRWFYSVFLVGSLFSPKNVGRLARR